MIIKLCKQAEKYLAKVPADIREKLKTGLNDISELNGDIMPLVSGGGYRYKIYQYRILFRVDHKNNIIYIDEINTRGNTKY